ncbi:MAG: hypothetical protein AAF443_07810 [Chlamydiota bacterium]
MLAKVPFLTILLQVFLISIHLEASLTLSPIQEALKKIHEPGNEQDEADQIKKNLDQLTLLVKNRMHDHLLEKIEIIPDEIRIEEALTIFRLAAAPAIQLKDDIKLCLIRYGYLLFHLIYYEISEANRKLYSTTYDEISRLVKQIRETLPPMQVEARFYLDCCTELLKFILINPTNYLKNVLKKSYTGALKELLPLQREIRRNKIKEWYIFFYGLHWYALDVYDLDSFSRYLKPYIERIFGEPSIKSTIKKIFKGSELTENGIISCLLAITNIIQAEGCSEELKQKLLCNYLFRFISSPFWKVRFLTIQFICEWAKEDSCKYIDDISSNVFIQAGKERNAYVQLLLEHYLENGVDPSFRMKLLNQTS